MRMSFWKKWLHTTPSSYDEWYERYRSQFYDRKYGGLIADQDFVVLDTETTGLDTAKDHVISMGAVKVRANEMEIQSSFSLQVKSESHSKDSKAIEIHGLIKTDERGLNPNEALPKLFEFLGTDIVVGHHIRFDLVMLEKMSKAHGGGPIINKIIDTATLAKRLDNPHPNENSHPGDFTLDHLCRQYHIATKARHTADGDAFITALLFLKLLNKLHKKGITKINDILGR